MDGAKIIQNKITHKNGTKTKIISTAKNKPFIITNIGLGNREDHTK